MWGQQTWIFAGVETQRLPLYFTPPPILSENVPNMYLYTLHHRYYQWIGLRENLQETIDFPIKYGAFL